MLPLTVEANCPSDDYVLTVLCYFRSEILSTSLEEEMKQGKGIVTGYSGPPRSELCKSHRIEPELQCRHAGAPTFAPTCMCMSRQ